MILVGFRVYRVGVLSQDCIGDVLKNESKMLVRSWVRLDPFHDGKAREEVSLPNNVDVQAGVRVYRPTSTYPLLVMQRCFCFFSDSLRYTQI